MIFSRTREFWTLLFAVTLVLHETAARSLMTDKSQKIEKNDSSSNPEPDCKNLMNCLEVTSDQDAKLPTLKSPLSDNSSRVKRSKGNDSEKRACTYGATCAGTVVGTLMGAILGNKGCPNNPRAGPVAKMLGFGTGLVGGYVAGLNICRDDD